jgi:NAD-dependent dihydropyrimidine dehydrogenase PreA subunit
MRRTRRNARAGASFFSREAAMAFKVVIDMEKCNGNGSCFDACPQDCFEQPKDGKAVLKSGYECINCEGCVASCPESAIEIVEA